MHTTLLNPEPLQAGRPLPASRDSGLSELLDAAQALANAGRLGDAIALCEQGLAQHPDAPELWCELGSNYLEQGALQSAELGFRTA